MIAPVSNEVGDIIFRSQTDEKFDDFQYFIHCKSKFKRQQCERVYCDNNNNNFLYSCRKQTISNFHCVNDFFFRKPSLFPMSILVSNALLTDIFVCLLVYEWMLCFKWIDLDATRSTLTHLDYRCRSVHLNSLSLSFQFNMPIDESDVTHNSVRNTTKLTAQLYQFHPAKKNSLLEM